MIEFKFGCAPLQWELQEVQILKDINAISHNLVHFVMFLDGKFSAAFVPFPSSRQSLHLLTAVMFWTSLRLHIIVKKSFLDTMRRRWRIQPFFTATAHVHSVCAQVQVVRAERSVIKLYRRPRSRRGSASRCSLTTVSPFWRVIMELQLLPPTGKYAAMVHAAVLHLAATGIQLGAEYLPLHCCHCRSVFSTSLTCRHSLCQTHTHTPATLTRVPVWF